MNRLDELEPRQTVDERMFFRTPPHDVAGSFDQDVAGFPKARKGRRTVSLAALQRTSCAVIRGALRREIALGTPFLFLPVGLAVGIIIYFSLPVEPAPWNAPAGLSLAALGLFVSRNRSGTVRGLLVVTIAIFAGMILAQVHTHRASTQMLGSEVTTRLTGRVLAVEERANGRTRYTVEVLATERPRLRYAPDIVRVTGAGPPGALSPGAGIHGVVRLTSPSGPAHPGGYHFAFHAFFDSYGANGFFLGKPTSADIVEADRLFDRARFVMRRMRLFVGQEIRQAAPGRAGAVAATLVTGDKAGIPEEVTEALRVTGLAHILSISGLHMALVAATVMASMRLAFAFFPIWSSRHPVKKYAAAGALVATGFYLFLAGAGVATQRSFVMLAIMLLALTFDRNAVTMRNLALAAIAILLISPEEILGPGFQMSFAATAALIATYTAWQERRQRRHEGRRRTDPPIPGLAAVALLSRYALGIVTTSLVAGLATGIFAAYHFGRVAPYGLLANLLAMPLVSLLVMPLAVLSMLALPFGLHVYPFKAMAWTVDQVIAIAEWVASLSPAVPVGQMPVMALVAFSAGLVVICLPSTWLRWVALPAFILGGAVWTSAPLPLGVISEDARQFAIIQQGDTGVRLHVNRARPNSFTVEQWTDAYRGTAIVKPKQSEIMTCDKTICDVALQSGSVALRIAYVAVEPSELPSTGPRSIRSLCAGTALVIFAKAPSPRKCVNGTPVLSAQMLALNGAAELFADPHKGRLSIRHALPGVDRPWLDHRRYSRAARNLGDWKPRNSQ